MKKTYIYIIIILIIVIFIFPSIFARKKVNEIMQNREDTSKEENIIQYDYSKYSTIKLYHESTNAIEELPIDEYLYGVVSAEMPASYEKEALKAQAIVARTYTLYQIINGEKKHNDADICDNSNCCQAWITKDDRFSKWDLNECENNWNKITEAVDSTQGRIVTYNGKPIDAFFHSNSGGMTETAINVWGGTNFPYLQSVETLGEDNYSQYNSEVNLKKVEFVNKLKEKYPDLQIDWNQENAVQITEYTESGRIKTLKVGNIDIPGVQIRMILGLKSTNFSFEIEGENIIFSVIGYGHGVGMSQTGADSMAKTGSTCEDILKHFYSNVDIIYVNDL